jgi:hypothetical protein
LSGGGWYEFINDLRIGRGGGPCEAGQFRENQSYCALVRSLQNNKPGAGWNQAQDDLLRQMVEDAVPPEVIADQLKRTVAEIRRRGDAIGLPLKWYQRISSARAS